MPGTTLCAAGVCVAGVGGVLIYAPGCVYFRVRTSVCVVRAPTSLPTCVQLDPCYHAPCDTLDNINEQCLFETARVAATVLERIVHSHRVKDSPFRQPLAGAAARRAEYKELLQQAHIKKRFSYACNENPEGED